MTLVVSHEVPDGSLPISAMKEELSRAYVHMLASSCGLTVGEWSQDYDCTDVTLSSSVDYSPNMYGPSIAVQLKCSARRLMRRDEGIALALDARAYDRMSRTNRSNPALLCVLAVPVEVGRWLELGADGLLARSHMYWRWGHEFPALKDGQGSRTVRLPRANPESVDVVGGAGCAGIGKVPSELR
ncbi:DUF4365 domain-containing protein [Nocardia macrotermitis]|uniref:DUF4365 domain-containing protein n=1 Tax=Nocardia macrotermitis TaxID=2585198 RepID=A0A7K0DFX7_9NOCA|nr:DUF4365 domain-containing protein [Nocardia macrotermitis]MQY24441.1 hypothetical protein [Nocardia macrotermitis]